MADDGVFATNAQIGYKAGAGKSAVSSATAYTDFYILQAESFINAVTRYNWSDNYATLNVDVKFLLQEAASNIAAMYVIQYDMSGFANIEHVKLMLDLLWGRADLCINLLKDQKVKTMMTGA